MREAENDKQSSTATALNRAVKAMGELACHTDFQYSGTNKSLIIEKTPGSFDVKIPTEHYYALPPETLALASWIHLYPKYVILEFWSNK